MRKQAATREIRTGGCIAGELLAEKTVGEAALPDVLASDGASIYLRHRSYSRELAEQRATGPHLYSPAGFLDGTWWHRTYWLYGSRMSSNYGGWPQSASRVPAGRLMVKDDTDVYGFGRFNRYSKIGGHLGLGTQRYQLYASSLVAKKKQAAPAARRAKPAAKANGKPRKRSGAANKVPSRWAESLPILVRGMVLCGDKTLFVAGPPDVFGKAEGDKPHPYKLAPAEGLREQAAALRGERGAKLLAVSGKDGVRLGEIALESPPVFDGLIAADGKLFMSALDGSLLCFGPVTESETSGHRFLRRAPARWNSRLRRHRPPGR